MRVRKLIIPDSLWGLVVSALLATGCCHYPKGHVAGPLLNRTPTNAITVVAYGDTRTGPWGLGDNAAQAIHGAVIDDIFGNNGPIDAVVFTGDAVMSNFELWKTCYWRCFLNQSNRFGNSHIPFYPALGNHEVLPGILPLIRPGNVQTRAVPGAANDQDRSTEISQAYDAGEALGNPRIQPEAAGPATPASTKQGRTLLKQWEEEINKHDANSANSARLFGQFQGQMQASFYVRTRDERCGSDAKIFNDDYLQTAKYDYLRPLSQGRSYYSTTIVKNGLRLKLIALDTNCLDSPAQKTFFTNEVSQFDGPIIVFGHHPPVNYLDENGQPRDGAPWDLVKGWDDYKPLFTNTDGKKIPLWIFGHVHDYQRRGPAGANNQAVAPVMLVAGGGGGSLDPSPLDFQWQPEEWPAALSKSNYNQVKISLTSTTISVEVRGTEKLSSDFKVIDSFVIPIATTQSKR